MAAPQHLRTIGFDSRRFYDDFKSVAASLGFSVGAAAMRLGVSDGTMTRLKNNRLIPDAATASALCKWAGLDIANYHIDLSGECDE